MTWLKDYFKEHFYDAKNMWYSRGIPINPLDSLDSLELLDSLQVEPIAIGSKIRLEQNTLQNYDVFDVQGIRVGKLSAYGFSDAAAKFKSAASAAKSSGIYFLRNRSTGKMQSVGIVK